MKKLIALITTIVLLSCYMSAFAIEESELTLALKNAQSLPEQLNYTVDFELAKTNVQNVHFNDGEGIIRIEAIAYLLKAIGMDAYDFDVYSKIRESRLRGYEDKHPFSDLWQTSGAVDMAFDLGIVYGNGDGKFRCFDRLTCNEAVALVMRCIYDNTEKDINVLYEMAKEMGVVKESDRFYNSRNSIIKAEEWMILLYRMRQHDLTIVPVTNSLTDVYSGQSGNYEYDLETEWKNKPVRRGFLFDELIAKHKFDGLRGDILFELLGNNDVKISDNAVCYHTYVFDYSIDETNRYVDAYKEANVIFELDKDGDVTGEPTLWCVDVEHGFVQTIDFTEPGNYVVDVEWYSYHPSFYYDAFEEKARNLSRTVFNEEKEQLDVVLDLVSGFLKAKESVMICNFKIKKDGTYKYNVYDDDYNDFKETLDSEQIDIIEKYLFSITEKYKDSSSVSVYGYQGVIMFDLCSDMGADTGLAYCEELPKYFYNYPEVIELGDGWYYFRTHYGE